jgi:hypothetical protein
VCNPTTWPLIAGISVEGPRVAYIAFHDENALTAQHLLVMDTATGKSVDMTPDMPREVQVASISIAGGWLFWVEQQGVQTSPVSPVGWAIKGRRLSGGDVHLIAHSTQAVPVVPTLVAGGSHLVWVQYLGLTERTADVFVLEIGSLRPRRILSHVATGQVAVTAHWVVFTKTAWLAHAPLSYTDDIWKIPLTGGTPVAVTHDGESHLPQASGDYVVWVKPKLGDPKAVMGKSLMSGSPAPRKLAGAQAANLAAGSGWVAYLDMRDHVWLAVEATAKHTLVDQRRISLSSRVSARDDRLAWTILGPHGGTTVCTATVKIGL